MNIVLWREEVGAWTFKLCDNDKYTGYMTKCSVSTMILHGAYFSMCSIRSKITSIPQMRLLRWQGSIGRLSSARTFRWWLQGAFWSCMAFSNAIGRQMVIRVSWMVIRDLPMRSRYESYRKLCWSSRRRLSSACNTRIQVRQASLSSVGFPNVKDQLDLTQSSLTNILKYCKKWIDVVFAESEGWVDVVHVS